MWQSFSTKRSRSWLWLTWLLAVSTFHCWTMSSTSISQPSPSSLCTEWVSIEEVWSVEKCYSDTAKRLWISNIGVRSKLKKWSGALSKKSLYSQIFNAYNAAKMNVYGNNKPDYYGILYACNKYLLRFTCSRLYLSLSSTCNLLHLVVFCMVKWKKALSLAVEIIFFCIRQRNVVNK